MTGAICGLLGCRSPGADVHTAPSAVPTASVASSSSASARPVASDRAPKLAYSFDLGCVEDIDEGLEAKQQLEKLRRVCAPGMMVRDVRNESIALSHDELQQVEVDLAAHACIRIGAVTSTPGAVIALKLLSPSGDVLVESKDSRVPLLLPWAGPICVGEAGQHVVQISSKVGESRILLGLWQTSAPLPVSSE